MLFAYASRTLVAVMNGEWSDLAPTSEYAASSVSTASCYLGVNWSAA